MNHILSGKRNASPKLAVRLEEATGISRVVWIFGSIQERRQYMDDFLAGKTTRRA